MNKFVFWTLLIVTCVTSLILLSCLPHNQYLRYQGIKVGAFQKASWIYERAVFDPTPIDIAFVGTSHTLNAVDSEIVENKINLGQTVKTHVVNFAIPALGRDMHRTLVKLLLEQRKPKVLFLELRETETRDQHPATHHLANASDMILSPLLVNTRYFGNLARLPLRQSKLFLQTQLPNVFGVSAQFNEESYMGAHRNSTLAFVNGKSRDVIRSEKYLVEKRKSWNSKNAHKLLRENKVKNFINYNANLSILRSIVNTAKEQGVEVYFIYLPDFGSQEKPIDEEIYLSMAPILYIEDTSIFTNANNWFDLGHLNSQGSVNFSHAISEIILSEVL